jgi:hypothetical protein
MLPRPRLGAASSSARLRAARAPRVVSCSRSAKLATRAGRSIDETRHARCSSLSAARSWLQSSESSAALKRSSCVALGRGGGHRLLSERLPGAPRESLDDLARLLDRRATEVALLHQLARVPARELAERLHAHALGPGQHACREVEQGERRGEQLLLGLRRDRRGRSAGLVRRLGRRWLRLGTPLRWHAGEEWAERARGEDIEIVTSAAGGDVDQRPLAQQRLRRPSTGSSERSSASGAARRALRDVHAMHDHLELEALHAVHRGEADAVGRGSSCSSRRARCRRARGQA